ncbi:MAG: EFR1 family ferrodoxin [Anaerovoracaceae bacterium]
MKINNVWAVFFSATGTTERIVTRTAANLASRFDASYKVHEFVKPAYRKKPLMFSKGDLVIVGVPVYAGRVPNVLVDFLRKIKGRGAVGIPVVLYGNRAYDDALIELRDIMEGCGIRCVAAAAYIGEHSFSTVLGAGRPDEDDMNTLWKFIDDVYEKVSSSDSFDMIDVPGNVPYMPYYVPKDDDQQELDFLRAKPITDEEKCVWCRVCAKACPMESINYMKPSEVRGICIKCGACIKKCEKNAKYFDDPGYIFHREQLERDYADIRREPEVFI